MLNVKVDDFNIENSKFNIHHCFIFNLHVSMFFTKIAISSLFSIKTTDILLWVFKHNPALSMILSMRRFLAIPLKRSTFYG